jgi:hypothetical protein
VIDPRTTETIVVDAAASATEEVRTGVAGEKWLVLYACLVTGTTATTFKVQSGATDLTGTVPFVQNTTLVFHGTENLPVWQAKAAGDALNLVVGGGTIDGWMVVQVQRA